MAATTITEYPWILKIIHIIVTLIICFGFIKVSNLALVSLFKKIVNKTNDVDLAKRIKTARVVLSSTIDIILLLLAVLHVLTTLGIDIKPILATAGVFGLAVSFAAQKSIEDLICGLTLLFEGQLRVGDIVEIQGVTGTVEKLNLRYVMLRDIAGSVHYFRNSTVSPITNFSQDYAYALLDIGVAYKEDVVHVMEVIQQIGADLRKEKKYHSMIKSEVEILGLERFEDSQVVIKFRMKTAPSQQWNVARALNLAIKKKFDELNIEIPFPQRVVTTVKD